MRTLPRISHQSCPPGLTVDVVTGDDEGGSKADSLITLTSDAPNLILLSETPEVTDAANDESPGAMADELPGMMLRDAADAATGELPDTTTDEFPGV